MREAASSGGWRRFCVIALLLLHAGLAFDTARVHSATHDEYWHLPIGLLNWTTGRFDFDNLNPPLVRMWGALPLLATSARPPAAEPPTDPVGYGDRFQQANAGRLHNYYVSGRCMIILLSVATGWLLFVWSHELSGGAAGWLTLLMWSLSPTVLAHASLVTTDLAAALFFVLTLFLLWRFATRSGWKAALLFGLSLGLAQSAKYTCLLLLPLSVLMWFVLRIRNSEVTRTAKGKVLAQWGAALGVSLFVLNAGYLFEGSFRPLKSYRFGSRAMSALQENLRAVDQCPVPLPEDYLKGIDHQRHVMEQDHPVYLNGRWSIKPFPQYYLTALAYKLPHAVHFLVAVTAVVLLFSRRERRESRKQLLLLLPFGLLLAIASFSSMQLGIRYILPVLPFLFLFAGQAAASGGKGGRLRRIAVFIGTAGMLLPLWHHPHHLAYFNELAGGPAGGREHLLDSNLDWGQDLPALAKFAEERSIEDLRLAYFGTLPPGEYGLTYMLPPKRDPEPGWHAVSVNFVMGRPHTIRDGSGRMQPLGPGEFAYFQYFSEKRQTVGASIDVYHLSETDVLEWRAEARRRFGQ